MLGWLESEPVERWLQTFILFGLVVLGGSSIADRVTSEPSVWDWVWLGIWVFAVVGFGVTTVSAWRNRGTPRVQVRVAPEDVPVEDVRAAIAATSDRIPAIKQLREMYPGLGLRDAKDLVEAQPPYR
ncbi:ribosomal protein L7/L12 [Prescottella agglutinans]|uniref:ribosomal protein L7/L12 n=1 Tax=Prescottella agglutinans TaxID=1644129 RepID=UPI003D99E0B5